MWCEVGLRSFPLVGPGEVGEEGSQRAERLGVVVAGRANHLGIQLWPTRCRGLARVHGFTSRWGSGDGPALIDALIVRSSAGHRFRGTTDMHT